MFFYISSWLFFKCIYHVFVIVEEFYSVRELVETVDIVACPSKFDGVVVALLKNTTVYRYDVSSGW